MMSNKNGTELYTNNHNIHNDNTDNDDEQLFDENGDSFSQNLIDEKIRNKEKIKCIFLCEFHMTAGPKIAAQVPDNYITKELFRIVNQYVIPKVQLQRSFLSVSLLGYKILGYPVRIDNKLYARNAFYFNICFVFDPMTRTMGFEPVVRKLTEYLLALELSSKLLSQQVDPTQMNRLTRLLEQVRNDINSKQVCMLQEGSSIIPLCVVPHYRETVVVHSHHAPVLINDFYKYVRPQWDLTTLRILPYVDGMSHVNRIAAMADVALGVVKDCVKHLILLGVAIIVPVFQYSNVYRATPKLSQLAKSKSLQKRCIEKCSKSLRQQATVRDVFRIFGSMAHGATFGELCVRFNPAALNINEKQMVLFGMMEGLIRIINRYPVTVSRNLYTGSDEDLSAHLNTNNTNNSSTLNESTISTSNTITTTTTTVPTTTTIATNVHFDTTTGTFKHQNDLNTSKPLLRGGRAGLKLHQQQQQQQQQQYHHCYNGLKSFDEICCAAGISSQQLESNLDKDKHVIVLLK